MREARLNLPAILVTGYSTDAVLIEALRAGMLDFIPKTPEYLDDLLSAIARVLKQTQAERQLEETQHRLVREEAARAAAERSAESLRKLVHALPAAIYTCDEQGRITMYNEAAVELWGRKPELSNESWCGSWRIYRADGTPVMLEPCPLAVALREQRLVRGEAPEHLERADAGIRAAIEHDRRAGPDHDVVSAGGQRVTRPVRRRVPVRRSCPAVPRDGRRASGRGDTQHHRACAQESNDRADTHHHDLIGRLDPSREVRSALPNVVRTSSGPSDAIPTRS